MLMCHRTHLQLTRKEKFCAGSWEKAGAYFFITLSACALLLLLRAPDFLDLHFLLKPALPICFSSSSEL